MCLKTYIWMAVLGILSFSNCFGQEIDGIRGFRIGKYAFRNAEDARLGNDRYAKDKRISRHWISLYFYGDTLYGIRIPQVRRKYMRRFMKKYGRPEMKNYEDNTGRTAKVGIWRHNDLTIRYRRQGNSRTLKIANEKVEQVDHDARQFDARMRHNKRSYYDVVRPQKARISDPAPVIRYRIFVDQDLK